MTIIRASRCALVYSVAAIIFTLSFAQRADAQSQTDTGQRDAIVDVIHSLFRALGTENRESLNSITAPHFYIFDNGVKYDTDSVIAFIHHLHATGTQIDWSVQDPDVHVHGDIAWIAYRNQGKITSGQVTHDQEWLESAVLEKRSGRWELDFLHSTRVPDATRPEHQTK
jgi:uncharacterized protein YuzE